MSKILIFVHVMSEDHIIIKGARVNNLRNIEVEIPRDKFVVITGLSGSGKSSLAFDTLYAEGQRRFAESLSSYARQFLGRMSKPDVDAIEGIPPAIAIEQKVNIRNPRSTVATTTEIYDYVRLIFARIGHTFSPITGEEVHLDNNASVVAEIEKSEADAVYILSDLKWSQREDHVELMLSLKQQGYTRLFDPALNAVKTIEEVLQASEMPKDMLLLVDRVKLPRAVVTGHSTVSDNATSDAKAGTPSDGTASSAADSAADNTAPSRFDQELKTRLWASVQDCFDRGAGRMAVYYLGSNTLKTYSNLFEADGITFREVNEYLFSFNSPIGACPVCGGLGKVDGISEDLIVPDKSKSIYDGAIAPYRGDKMGWFRDLMCRNGLKYGLDVFKPYCRLTEEEKDIIWKGRAADTEEESIIGLNEFFKWVESQRYKIQYKYMLARFSGRSTCQECGGSRLRREALWVKVGGKSIKQVLGMTIEQAYGFFTTLELSEHDAKIAEKAIKEVTNRLQYLMDVGLQYLTLDRASNTLSGGESQRINLVTALGSCLVGSLYILDEPSIGLHPRDTERLIGVLKKLRNIGNTVVVVEHDEEIMRAADQIIDLGPGAGIHGGQIVFQGTLEEGLKGGDGKTAGTGKQTAGAGKKASGKAGGAISEAPESLTLCYLGHPEDRYKRSKITPNYFISVEGAQEHNLKDIDVKFPLGCLTAVTGVSGSGKSTLVGDILFPALQRHLEKAGPVPGTHRGLGGSLDRIHQVEYVDQNPIGKSSRSNPVTYLKIYDDIRKLLADQQYAKISGYTPSFFSFNQDGGRCPECQGDGFIKIPMQFMSDVTMVCEACGGKRFKADILQVRYREKNVDDILDMDVEQAIEFFSADKGNALAQSIATKLKYISDVGLGYIKLGQSSSTLSGGESQRIKLAYFLSMSSESRRKHILFIFDEPTTGLHFQDVATLLKCFDQLIAKGHSVVVVEHNTDVIGAADWVIDLGPDAGDAGGQVVYCGAPEKLPKTTFTGKYIK